MALCKAVISTRLPVCHTTWLPFTPNPAPRAWFSSAAPACRCTNTNSRPRAPLRARDAASAAASTPTVPPSAVPPRQPPLHDLSGPRVSIRALPTCQCRGWSECAART
eukprot:ctg_1101.g366